MFEPSSQLHPARPFSQLSKQNESSWKLNRWEWLSVRGRGCSTNLKPLHWLCDTSYSMIRPPTSDRSTASLVRWSSLTNWRHFGLPSTQYARFVSWLPSAKSRWAQQPPRLAHLGAPRRKWASSTHPLHRLSSPSVAQQAHNRLPACVNNWTPSPDSLIVWGSIRPLRGILVVPQPRRFHRNEVCRGPPSWQAAPEGIF